MSVRAAKTHYDGSFTSLLQSCSAHLLLLLTRPELPTMRVQRSRTVLVSFSLCITVTLLFQVESTQPPFSCDPASPSTNSYRFCKTTLPISERVRDLVSRLTLDEKVSQLVNSAPAIPRLGIPAYQWWSEALHGVSNAGPGIRFNGSIRSATSFPQVILTAASFDDRLWYRIGQVTTPAVKSKSLFSITV